MPAIAQNHLQYIIEVAIILQIGIMFILNLAPLSLSLVMMVALVLGVGLTALFGFDAMFLFLPGFSHSEFTHPFGAVAILAIVTALAALPMMKEAGINIKNLRNFILLLLVLITITGGLMHKSFLLLWFIGLLVGFFLISKSFRQQSIFTVKRIALVIVAVVAGFGSLELLSRVLDMSILSPVLRIMRIDQFALPSIKMVLQNATLTGHNIGSCFWGDACQGGSDGYISLPISLIMLFGLPFPVFYGILVSKKDVIDYMLPGIFGVTFDFGYITLFFLLLWCVGIVLIGARILRSYQKKRENGDKSCLGREALLLGSFSAFIAQTLVGLFVINRSINGTALLTFLFLSALVLGHLVFIKNK
ncbi:MAG TPA: hypothetical protein VK444_02040 [Methanobacteriaceae archaeon]|nr:hypothetical protein [Methanobacteriaceae archaeon]